MSSITVMPAAGWLALEDKVCVVTGAASGIGAEIARQLASVGARVAVLEIGRASCRKECRL